MRPAGELKPLATPAERAEYAAVARVNLAAALVFVGRHDEIPCEIDEPNRLLRMNLLEIAAQSALARGDFAAAGARLDEGVAMAGADSLYAFFLRKWRGVLDLKTRRRDDLESLRGEARRLGHFESLRDLDYHEAVTKKDRATIVHLYFGTPHASLRGRFNARELATYFKLTPRTAQRYLAVATRSGLVAPSNQSRRSRDYAKRQNLSVPYPPAIG